MAGDPGIESVFPLLLAETHAHRNLVIESDTRIGLEGDGSPALAARVPASKITGDRPPDHRQVDRARSQIALDDQRRILVHVAALSRVEHALIEQLVAQQPVDARRACERSNLERML